jgi:hypothetical protein
MFKINDQKGALSCPRCGRRHQIKLGDFNRARIIECPCGDSLMMNDPKGDLKKIDNALKKLDQTFKKFGRR